MLNFVETYSYIGLFAILLIEESGIPLPIPGDIFIAIASGLPNSNYFFVVATVITATLLGSTVLFTLAKIIGHPLIVRYGKYIKITPENVKKIEKWFTKYGGWTIVIGRLIPGLRIFTPIVAGLFGISYKTFWLYTTIAAFIWANVYFVIGKFFGEIISFLVSK